MTLADIARANGMSLEEFFAHAYKAVTGSSPPKGRIREAVITLNTEGLVPPFIQTYINLFNVHSTVPN